MHDVLEILQQKSQGLCKDTKQDTASEELLQSEIRCLQKEQAVAKSLNQGFSLKYIMFVMLSR